MNEKGLDPEAEDELTRLRRRDRHLSGLLTSARALVQVDDVDALLQELVDRAADLMGADVTYLSVYDEQTADLWVRSSHGAVSAELKTLRVPAGVGLASKIVDTKTAHWTSNYRDAELLAHPTVSAAVEAEGILCLVGAPMLAGGEILGVLFAADRDRHDFTADQVALLTAFADHAAMVVHRTRLFAAVEEEAQRASLARRDAECRAAEAERAAQLHEHLTELTLGGHDAPRVCEALAEAIGHRVCAARPSGEPLTDPLSPWWDDAGQAKAGLRTALDRSAAAGHLLADHVCGEPVAVTTTVAVGTPLVSLVVDRPEELSALDRRTVERTAQLLALLLIQVDAQTRAEETVRGELAADLIAGHAGADALRRRALAQGIELAEQYTPIVLPLESGRRGTVRRHLAGSSPALLIDDAPDGLTVLVNGTVSAERALDLRRLMGPQLAGSDLMLIGRTARLSDLRDAVDVARRLVRMLPDLGVGSGTVDLADFAPYLALFGDHSDLAADFVDRALGDLVEWDERHHSDLVTTLAALLGHDGNLRRTAEQLYVHVNTVKQRVARIAALLGPDWREPEAQFRLRVAVRLHHARRAAGG